MHNRIKYRFRHTLLCWLGVMSALLLAGAPSAGPHAAQAHMSGFTHVRSPLPTSNANQAAQLARRSYFLPLVTTDAALPLRISPFGVESQVPVAQGVMRQRILDLKVGWTRINGRISWRALQPNEGDPIRWELLANFETELRVLRANGIRSIVVVDDHPAWATINVPVAKSCGAIRADKFSAFAEFARALVARYKQPEFDVHHWELGNEPDVDPILVGTHAVFGCWGDRADPFYGGRHYGEMVKVVGPAIKAEDPTAQVWTGGLLLDQPNTTEPGQGRPELFLQGILEAGAAPYFDVVSYHSHPAYWTEYIIDHDNAQGWVWDELGGMAVGKARFLRQMMQKYGVDKPLFLSEASLGCPNTSRFCHPPGPSYFEAQANYIVRAFVRAVAGGIQGAIWYSLDGPGWRSTGLLTEESVPQPAYMALRELNTQLEATQYIGPVSYGNNVEAYAFARGGEHVHVAWTKTDTDVSVSIPRTALIGVSDRTGRQIDPSYSGSAARIEVAFEPIYIIRRP